MSSVSRSTLGCLFAILSVHGDEDGQDMVEYALLAALIAVVAIGVIILIGPYIRDVFGDVLGALAST